MDLFEAAISGKSDISDELIAFLRSNLKTTVYLLQSRMENQQAEYPFFLQLFEAIPELITQYRIQFHNPYILFQGISRDIIPSNVLTMRQVKYGSIVINQPEYSQLPSWMPAPLKDNDYALLKQLRDKPAFGDPIGMAIAADDVARLNIEFSKPDCKEITELKTLSYSNDSPLQCAIKWNAMECFRFLMINHSPRTNAMLTAIACGRDEMIELLEQDGENFKKTAECAIENWQNRILKWLVDTDRDIPDSLDAAARAFNEDAALLLLEANVPPADDLTGYIRTIPNVAAQIIEQSQPQGTSACKFTYNLVEVLESENDRLLAAACRDVAQKPNGIPPRQELLELSLRRIPFNRELADKCIEYGADPKLIDLKKNASLFESRQIEYIMSKQ